MPKFITLAGKKQVGKDTSANIIRDILCNIFLPVEDNAYNAITVVPTHKYPIIHIVHFADALKQACSIIFGIPLSDMESEAGKNKLTDISWPWRRDEKEAWRKITYNYYKNLEKKMTVREILQFVGTELFRSQLDPDIWVKSVYRKPYGKNDVVIVADCRFPNEATFAKDNGILIKIERNTKLQGDTHVSELALDSFNNYDYIINNNSTLGELKRSLITILDTEGFYEN